MEVLVSCQCGQAFSSHEQLAGQVVSCPACHRPIRIPHSGRGSGLERGFQAPRATTQGSLSLLLAWVGGTIAIVFLLSVGIGVWVLLNGGKSDTPIAGLLPLDRRQEPLTALPPSSKQNPAADNHTAAKEPQQPATDINPAIRLPKKGAIWTSSDGRFEAWLPGLIERPAPARPIRDGGKSNQILTGTVIRAGLVTQRSAGYALFEYEAKSSIDLNSILPAIESSETRNLNGMVQSFGANEAGQDIAANGRSVSISFGPYSAIETHSDITLPHGTRLNRRARYYVINNRLYVLSALGNLSHPNTEVFFSSFRMKVPGYPSLSQE